jgi:hypothetical protein
LSLYPPKDNVLRFAQSIINDRDENVVKAAIEYLGNSANPTLLPLLGEKASHGVPFGRSARTEALQLEIIVNPMAAFTKISSNPNPINAKILRLLEQHIAHIPSATFIAALESLNRDIRVLGTRTLLERDELSKAQATRLLTDESFRVRQIAL